MTISCFLILVGEIKANDLRIDQDIGRVYRFIQKGDKLWVNASKGLFRLPIDGSSPPTRINVEVGRVHGFFQAGDQICIDTDKGLFRLPIDGSSRPIRINVDVGEVYGFIQKGDQLWIIASKGLFRLPIDGSLTPIRINVEVDSLSKFIQASDKLWINASKGLFRLPINDSSPPTRINVEVNSYSKFIQAGDQLWINASKGLFRLPIDGSSPPALMLRDLDFLNLQFIQTGDNLWICDGGWALFHLFNPKDKWDPKIEFQPESEKSMVPGSSVTIKWKITNFVSNTTPQLVKQKIIIKDEREKNEEIDVGGPDKSNCFTASVPLKKKGKYILKIETTDLFNNKGYSSEWEIEAGYPVGYLHWKDILKLILVSYSGLNILVFIVLLGGARRSQWCFNLLTDPAIRKFGIYFGFVLRNIRWLQLWAFERYYDALKASIHTNPYVPVLLKRPDDKGLLTTEMLSELHKYPKILLQGKPGTGKTIMLNELLRIYCHNPNLWSAWKQYRIIPILIPLRELPGQNIPDIVKAAFERFGFSFSDDFFLIKLFERGGFLLMLDGLNEVDLDKEIVHYASTHPKVKMLLTSQEELHSSDIVVYHLPLFDAQGATDLIKAFMGDEKGSALAEKLGLTIHELKSGYDIRLVIEQANTILTGEGPLDRMELYEATINNAIHDEIEYPRHVIEKTAFNQWLTGKRLFACNEELTETLITPLLKRPASIVVRRGIEQYEFRHDLLRSYLAACWLVLRAPSISVRLDLLKDDVIWQLPTEDQNSMFEFATLLIPSAKELQEVASFAAEYPVKRVRLFEAAKKAAKDKGWVLNLKIS
jgi:hypothetical protein